MEKCNLKDNTMKERDLEKVYGNICPTDAKKLTDKGFVNIDNGSMDGTHWVCSIKKDKKSLFVTRLVELLMNFYSNNYLNQLYIIIIKFKV